MKHDVFMEKMKLPPVILSAQSVFRFIRPLPFPIRESGSLPVLIIQERATLQEKNWKRLCPPWKVRWIRSPVLPVWRRLRSVWNYLKRATIFCVRKTCTADQFGFLRLRAQKEDWNFLILLAWYPGARGGKAVADLLFGTVSPSGKLPITFYRDLEGMPEFTDYSMKNRTYRYMEKEALYPFGYGLTYGDVRVTDAKVLSEVTGKTDIEVEVTVKNEGDTATQDVVQIYIKDMASSLAVPNFSLCGFRRVSLAAGEGETFVMKIANAAMNVVDERGERRIDSRNFKLFVGTSQPDDRSAVITGKRPVELDIKLV